MGDVLSDMRSEACWGSAGVGGLIHGAAAMSDVAEEGVAPDASMEDPPGSDGEGRVKGRVKEGLPH